MKSSVVVTLADSAYITKAKQLFSSVYFNAGWKGDYLLLAHNISNKNLTWFTKKGIVVKKCEPLFHGKVGRYSPVLTSKIYLFTEDMKKWKKVIYLDTDIIVRASLDKLLEIEGYAAVPEFDRKRLVDQFLLTKKSDKEKMKKILKQLGKDYNLNSLSFNAGVIVFSTDAIKHDTFSNMKKLIRMCGGISAYGDQAMQNLYFYHTWKKLPQAYNLNPDFLIDHFNIKPGNIKGIILHFIAIGEEHKPWHTKNYFYSEWKENVKKADLIDTRKILAPREVWSEIDIKLYTLYLKIKYYFYLPNHPMYVLDASKALKHSLQLKYPRFYFLLKKTLKKTTRKKKY